VTNSNIAQHGGSAPPGTAYVADGAVFIPVVALGDGNAGNLLHAVDNGDGTSYLGGASSILNYPSAAYNAANAGTSFSTAQFSGLAVDVTVSAFTGGTSPSVTFFLDRLGADGVWYRVWTSAALTSAGATSVQIGPYPSGTGIFTAVLTGTARFGWSFGGTVQPTAVTFSASVYGRP
jgi:hypothetical protein